MRRWLLVLLPVLLMLAAACELEDPDTTSAPASPSTPATTSTPAAESQPTPSGRTQTFSGRGAQVIPVSLSAGVTWIDAVHRGDVQLRDLAAGRE